MRRRTSLPRRYQRAWWPTSGAGSSSGGGSCWSPRATGRPSGWPSCCAARASAPGRRRRPGEPPEPGLVHVATGHARARLHLAVGAARGAGRGRPGRAARRGPPGTQRMPSRRRGGIDPLQLTPGDYIVHEQHGVGRYLEMTSRTVQGATREYLVIEYAPSKRGPAAGPAVPAHRPAGRGHQVLRRRGAEPAPARRRRLGQDQGPGPQGGPRDRGRADPAVLGADGLARARVRAGHALAARAGGRVPLRRDARPAGRHRRGQAGHGEAGPDGPADLRRRRLRQDRDRGAGRVQGGAGRQAGRRAGADHAAGPAAPGHLQRAVRAVPGDGQADVAVPERRRGRRHAGRAWPTARSTW